MYYKQKNFTFHLNMNSFIVYFLFLIFPSLVYSHHPLNGGMMEDFSDGFLSGIGHPILGLDHLIFILGVGLISYLSKKLFNFSFSFIGGTFLGMFSIIFGLYLPFYEIIVSLTLLLLGYLILIKHQANSKGFIFLLFGIFHGWAYGSILLELPQIDLNVVFGYSTGLLITQILIVFLGYQFFKYVIGFKFKTNLVVPIFSGILVGIASTKLFEIFESGIINILN